MAIKTKGTGADKNRVSWSHDDESPKESVTFEYGSLGRVTSVTDPRGNVTTGTYDAKGNRIKVQFFWDRKNSAERDFAYDTYGQLTAITNPPDANGRSRVDTFTSVARPGDAMRRGRRCRRPRAHLGV